MPGKTCLLLTYTQDVFPVGEYGWLLLLRDIYSVSFNFSSDKTEKKQDQINNAFIFMINSLINQGCQSGSVGQAEVEFVHPVTVGGSVKFLPAV